MALTEIQKDIERRNIELGRKLLRLEKLEKVAQEAESLSSGLVLTLAPKGINTVWWKISLTNLRNALKNLEKIP